MKKDTLSLKADEYAHRVYKLTFELPKNELYGTTSQLRRAAISVPLNMVEGYARQSIKTEIQFLRFAYGSLKESQYLIDFALIEGLITRTEADAVTQKGDELVRMLWAKTKTLERKNKD
ncbi:four helix bundle protein [Candidatus Saccharibacteria bacterium]|nr:four helix bundle protein [Candidatus Saccharibacteria bacterium]